MLKLLYETKDHVIARDGKGRLTKITKNKFNDGEVVQLSENHYSGRGITIVKTPTYTKERGWIYGENFIDLQGGGGGSCFWNNEELFKKIDNSILKLYAERIRLKRTIEEHKRQLKIDSEQLEKIEYSLSISVDDFDKVEKVCRICEAIFIRNTTNINSNHCDNCENKP